jgi:hypothetical protein
MSYSHGEGILARQYQLLVDEGYLTANGAEARLAPAMAEAELSQVEPPQTAAAKIAVAATFGAEGVLLESEGKTRDVPFLPPTNARSTGEYRDDTLALRRDLTLHLLDNSDRLVPTAELHQMVPPGDSGRHKHLMMLVRRWWDANLRIGTRALIVPLPYARKWEKGIYVPNPWVTVEVAREEAQQAGR